VCVCLCACGIFLNVACNPQLININITELFIHTYTIITPRLNFLYVLYSRMFDAPLLLNKLYSNVTVMKKLTTCIYLGNAEICIYVALSSNFVSGGNGMNVCLFFLNAMHM